tara:strand:+ start:826434 stop:826553 length:120 start_codon:yes stop_codon:yes gene_type:complete
MANRSNKKKPKGFNKKPEPVVANKPMTGKGKSPVKPSKK